MSLSLWCITTLVEDLSGWWVHSVDVLSMTHSPGIITYGTYNSTHRGSRLAFLPFTGHFLSLEFEDVIHTQLAVLIPYSTELEVEA